MQGLRSDSALFAPPPPEKAGLRQPLLISTPRLVLGTPKERRACVAILSSFGPPGEGRGEVATSDFLLYAQHFGLPRMLGLRSDPALF